MRLRDIVLLTKNKAKNNDPLNHTATYTERILHKVRVTELYGAQAQNNALGARYEHTYVIRLEGIYYADKIAFLEDYQKNPKDMMSITQERRHHFKTAFYVGVSKVNS